MNEHSNMLFDAVINDTDSIKLMLHTAVNDFSVISDHTESIKWQQADSVESWGGRSEARYSDSNQVKLGPFKWEGLGFWEGQRSGPGSDGKFGLNSFEDLCVEIQFNENRLITRSALPVDLNEYEKCPLIQKNGIFFVALQFEVGKETLSNEFLVHTGYGGTLLLDDGFVLEHQLAEKLEITDQNILTDSYGNEIAVNKAKLPKVEWLNQELNDVPVGFFQGEIARQQMSVMGSDFIKRFDIIFDANREFIYLKPNDYLNTGFSTI